MFAEHLKALDLARDGQWEASHEIVQAHSDSFSSLIHAYLHRVEGDQSNAAYWYRRADEEVCQLSPEAELLSLYERCAQAGI
ncbi:hypothetical protein [Granulosicoccus antarcticus]|uniref:Bacterial transcriptional activator domain-containing protein n=1 Tax=Granulosicoccus antarcticus IMCC3135 TaxID=1192854 RepID=A0A2Z2NZL2_9GAMM|nr:hypothetical protein [Granulosicoccus antarcticus]ASJ76719.1 hypothetical protein IMCC3135_33375 [Granulosicoccus antarcticus IMCC3135]